MRFEEITLTQRDKIESIRSASGHILLAHSFCTVFLWRETLKLTVHLEDDFFVIKFERKGDNAYLFPCGNRDKTRAFIESHRGEKDFSLYYLREADKDWLETEFPGLFCTEYDDTSCEYIFDREEHLLLHGQKFSKMRREGRRLCEAHTVESSPLTSGDAQTALVILEDWERHHKPNGVVNFDDSLVARNALSFFDELNMMGTITCVDSVPYALVIGGEITADTYSIQIAKMREPLDGLLAQALHSCFELIDPRYRLINGDDDMGIAGIRLSKRKLQPCTMNEVWRATHI